MWLEILSGFSRIAKVKTLVALAPVLGAIWRPALILGLSGQLEFF